MQNNLLNAQMKWGGVHRASGGHKKCDDSGGNLLSAKALTAGASDAG